MLKIYRLINEEGAVGDFNIGTVAFRIIAEEEGLLVDIDYEVFRTGILRGFRFGVGSYFIRRVRHTYPIQILSFSNWTTQRGDEYHSYPFHLIDMSNQYEALDVIFKILDVYGVDVIL